MMKVLFFLKRLEGLTHEQFRDHMENVHVKIAEKYFVHLMSSYSRYYLDDSQGSPLGPHFDCVSEWTLPDEATFQKILGMFADPVIGPEFQEDEKKFLDLPACVQLPLPTKGMEGANKSV